MSLRKARSFLLLIAGLLAIGLSHTMDGFAAVLGITLVTSAGLTLVYVFLKFDQQINPKIVMEMIADAFSGVVIFTYPTSNDEFLLIVFSFWAVMMGMLYLTSGLMDESNKDVMWSYALMGIVLIVLGFVILHYDAAYKSSVLYVVGFTLILYSGMNLVQLYRRKREVY